MFKFYEKETTSKRTVQKRTAMEQNTKIQIVSNDLVRRMCNTMEELGEQERHVVIDGYAQKLLNSGYSKEETRSIIVKGLKGYEGRKTRCKLEGRSLWRTSVESRGARLTKKLTAKTSWYKNKKKNNFYAAGGGNCKRELSKKEPSTKSWEQKSILFVEQTREGELGKRLREVMQRLAPVLGFSIKVVERVGSNLKSKFPQSSLWEGTMCGRAKCITCNQGAEVLVPCTRKSLVYENICGICNEGAGGKEEVKGGSNPDIPSIYVGETSRTIFERAGEHWGAARGSKAARNKSHIAKHQEMVHPNREPDFKMRVVKFHRSALARQTGEAVRIRRRGGEGAVLNSKGEFNRSFIPRLQLVEEEVIRGVELAEEQDILETVGELELRDGAWETNKTRERAAKGAKNCRIVGSKRSRGSKEGRPLKRLKFDLISKEWGSLTREFKDDPGDANGDCGRDDPIQSMNDDVEHGNKRVGGSIPMPSSDNNDMWNNKKDVSVSVCVSGSVSREQQKCKIMDGKCCNGCSVTFISVTSKEWVQNKKTRLFGWRSKKVTKPICSKNTGRANLSTTAKSESGESVI